jgi:hypothetical protein
LVHFFASSKTLLLALLSLWRWGAKYAKSINTLLAIQTSQLGPLNETFKQSADALAHIHSSLPMYRSSDPDFFLALTLTAKETMTLPFSNVCA